jgi:hypothetical protein
MKVQLVTAYRVSHLKRYGVTVRGNVTSVTPPLDLNMLLSTRFLDILSLCFSLSVGGQVSNPYKMNIKIIVTHI